MCKSAPLNDPPGPFGPEPDREPNLLLSQGPDGSLLLPMSGPPDYLSRPGLIIGSGTLHVFLFAVRPACRKKKAPAGWL